MAIGWDESKVKRDAHGRFSRFEVGNIPSADFMDAGEADAWVRETFDALELVPEEASALDDYANFDYGTINSALRNGEPATPETQEKISALDAVMERNATPEDAWVTRAVSPEAFGGKRPDELVGSTFEDPGFMSTTMTKDLPLLFDVSTQQYPAVLRLKVPGGTPAYSPDVASTSEGPSEHELLLGRGTRFDITGVKQTTDGRFEIFGDVRS